MKHLLVPVIFFLFDCSLFAKPRPNFVDPKLKDGIDLHWKMLGDRSGGGSGE